MKFSSANLVGAIGMLVELRIENLAVIAESNVQFGAGFCALTGETGAGKSLLLEALALVRGGRAASDLIREGAEQCVVEARLQMEDAELHAGLVEQGYCEAGDPAIVVRRLLRADGDNRVYLNGRMATVQTLQDWVGPAVEIYAQHAQARLLRSPVQRRYLDRFGAHHKELADVHAAWQAWQTLVDQQRELAAAADRRDQEIAFLRYQIERFEQVQPHCGELQALQEQLSAVAASAQTAQAVQMLRARLADQDGCALEHLFAVEAALTQLQTADAAEVREAVTAAAEAVREAVQTGDQLGRRLEEVEDPAPLEARIKELERLARPFGGDLDTALEELETMRDKLARLENLETELADLEAQNDAAEQHYRQAAERLSDARHRAAEVLAPRVEKELHALSMPQAKFRVDGLRASASPGPDGIDDVRFLLAANPGGTPRPLQRVASGGEMSRVLLALQTVFAQAGVARVYVFDEVDAGIGGEVALEVGRRMRGLGNRAQVLAVTHTPQVAAFAHRQVRLSKAVDAADGARTHAQSLEGEDRRQELARMLGATDSETAQDHARALLARAGGEAA